VVFKDFGTLVEMSLLWQKHLKLICSLISMNHDDVHTQHPQGPSPFAPIDPSGRVSCPECAYTFRIQNAPNVQYGLNMPFTPVMQFQPFVLPFYYVVPLVQPLGGFGYLASNFSYPPRYDFLDDEGLLRFDSEFSGLHNSYHVKRIQHFQPTLTIETTVHGQTVRHEIPNDGSAFGNGLFAVEEKNTWLGRISDGILGYRVNWFPDNYMNGPDQISPFHPIHKGIFFRRTRNFTPLNWGGIGFENRFNQLLYGNPLQPGQPPHQEPEVPPVVVQPGPGHPPAPHAPIGPARPTPLIAGVYPFEVVGTEPQEVRVRIHPEWGPDERGSPILIARPVEEPKDVDLIFRVKIPRERREIYA